MLSRRNTLKLLAGAAPALASLGAFAQAPAMSKITAYTFSFQGLDGATIRLADYAGKPILVVNTASQCGFTPQFTGLQQLWTQFHDRGLMIIGVPSNDFGGCKRLPGITSSPCCSLQAIPRRSNYDDRSNGWLAQRALRERRTAD
ncbi:MAG: redoxin domain-containing protein, partial [Xanthobacteraceae bacterium]